MRFAVIAPLCAALAACGSPDPAGPAEEKIQAADALEGIAVSNAVIRLPVLEGRPGAGYMMISNGSGNDVALASIYVEGADRTALHESKMDGGKMTMEAVVEIAIPAYGQVALKQGGLHLMVFGLSPDDTNQTREITLIFSSGDKVSVEAKLERPGAPN